MSPKERAFRGAGVEEFERRHHAALLGWARRLAKLVASRNACRHPPRALRSFMETTVALRLMVVFCSLCRYEWRPVRASECGKP